MLVFCAVCYCMCVLCRPGSGVWTAATTVTRNAQRLCPRTARCTRRWPTPRWATLHSHAAAAIAAPSPQVSHTPITYNKLTIILIIKQYNSPICHLLWIYVWSSHPKECKIYDCIDFVSNCSVQVWTQRTNSTTSSSRPTWQRTEHTKDISTSAGHCSRAGSSAGLSLTPSNTNCATTTLLRTAIARVTSVSHTLSHDFIWGFFSYYM